MDAFVARQPIFDRSRQVDGYELLFRSSAEHNEFDGTEAASATMQVLATSFLSIGLEDILCGKKAFLNFDRSLIMSGVPSMLPPEKVVLEILESVEPDAELLSACEELRRQGYTIALDDFACQSPLDRLTAVAQIIKVDLRRTNEQEQADLVRTYKPRGITMLAEKVETHEEFERARQAGFDFFQGYFFARPMTVRGRQVPASKASCIRLLNEIQKPELDFKILETMISQDVSLCYKLMRYVNSWLFHPVSEIRSIGHALAMLGETGVRHWIALATLLTMAKDKPSELVTHALVRARFAEGLARLGGLPEPPRAFLMGLVSLLDAFLDCPLEEALSQLSVDSVILDALLEAGSPNAPLTRVSRLMRHYETGDWQAVSDMAAGLGVKVAAVGSEYAASTLWVQQALHATSRKTETRRHVRHAVDGSVRILWNDESGREHVGNARLVNISTGGMRLQVSEKIPVRAVVSCNAGSIGVFGTGSVRYCIFSKGKYDIGLEFTNGTGWREPLAAPRRDAR